MLLYKETFPLKKGLRFSSYIKKLEEEFFPSYTLFIKKTNDIETYNMEIVLTSFNFPWDLRAPIIGGVLFNKCTIQYNKDERDFTISAFISKGNLFTILFFLLMTIFCFSLFLFDLIINYGKNMFPLMFSMIVVAFPIVSIYLSERKLLNRIGDLGSE